MEKFLKIIEVSERLAFVKNYIFKEYKLGETLEVGLAGSITSLVSITEYYYSKVTRDQGCLVVSQYKYLINRFMYKV
jgi:hypothetical protein